MVKDFIHNHIQSRHYYSSLANMLTTIKHCEDNFLVFVHLNCTSSSVPLDWQGRKTWSRSSFCYWHSSCKLGNLSQALKELTSTPGIRLQIILDTSKIELSTDTIKKKECWCLLVSPWIEQNVIQQRNSHKLWTVILKYWRSYYE